jgi:hypothetical protein
MKEKSRLLSQTKYLNGHYASIDDADLDYDWAIRDLFEVFSLVDSNGICFESTRNKNEVDEGKNIYSNSIKMAG